MDFNFDKSQYFLRTNRGIAAGGITLIVYAIFSLFPVLAGILYRNGFFQIFRLLFDYSINLLPFPLLYLEVLILPFVLFFYGKKFQGRRGLLLLFPMNLLGWIVALFMWMWGFNYCCPDILSDEEQNGMSATELFEFGKYVSEELKLNSGPHLVNLEQEISHHLIQESVEEQIQSYGILTLGNPKFNEIGMHAVMRRLGIAGIYIPFTGQAHGDKSFLPATSFFIMAHELSHAYGVTSEAEADFMAYVSLKEMNTKERSALDFRYFADLELLRSIRYQLHQSDSTLFNSLDTLISLNVMKDIVAIRNNARSYPEYFPGMQETVNNQYLKLMGVNDGVKNYDRFVDLAFIYHKKKNNPQ